MRTHLYTFAEISAVRMVSDHEIEQNTDAARSQSYPRGCYEAKGPVSTILESKMRIRTFVGHDGDEAKKILDRASWKCSHASSRA